MKIHLQRRADENLIAALRNLTELLGIEITETGLNGIRNHPDYPSLKSISDLLHEWNIDNISANLTVRQLNEIPYPAIAYLRKNNGHFVVLKMMKDGKIHYIDPDVGLLIKPVEEFAIQWSGIALLVEINSTSGEVEFERNKKLEAIDRRKSIFLYGLWILLFVLPFPTISAPLTINYLLKGLGAIISFWLFRKQNGLHNSVIDSFCRTDNLRDCDAVIKSPASKFLGLISLSELGVLYFAGGLLSIILGRVSSISVAASLFVMSIIGLVFSMFSIYYQGVVIRKWCNLCLAVMGVVWLEFGVNLLYRSEYEIDLDQVVVVGMSFLLPSVVWITVRQHFNNSLKIPLMQRKLNSFLKNQKVFQAFLSDQNHTDLTTFQDELLSGSPDAPVQITVVSSPLCVPCALAHHELKTMDAKSASNIKIIHRFVVNPDDSNIVSNRVLSKIISIKLEDSTEMALMALSEWYQSGFNYDSWDKRYKTDLAPENQVAVKHLLSQHYEWSRKVGIVQTPTFFINGRRVPEQYSIDDIKYHIRGLAITLTPAN